MSMKALGLASLVVLAASESGAQGPPATDDTRAKRRDALVERLNASLQGIDKGNVIVRPSVEGIAGPGVAATSRPVCAGDVLGRLTAYAEEPTLADLGTLRLAVSAAGPAERPSAERELAMGLTALGLYTEASAHLRDLSPETTDHANLVSFLREPGVEPDPKLVALTECSAVAALAVVVSRIERAVPGSADELEATLPTLRRLPVSVRTDLAVRLIPGLLAANEVTLARRVLNALPDAEMSRDPRQRFLVALGKHADAPGGDLEGLRPFVSDPRFRQILMEHIPAAVGGLEPTSRAVILGEEVSRLRTVSGAQGTASVFSTEFVLRELLARGDYDRFIAFARLPAMSDPGRAVRVRALLREQLAADLDGCDRAAALAALALLAEDPLDLREIEGAEALFTRAAVIAYDLGIAQTGAALAQGMPNDPALVDAVARLNGRRNPTGEGVLPDPVVAPAAPVSPPTRFAEARASLERIRAGRDRLNAQVSP